MVSVLLLGVQSNVAYNSDNSVIDNRENNRVCSLGTQECRGQMIPHHDDGLAKEIPEWGRRRGKRSNTFVGAN